MTTFSLQSQQCTQLEQIGNFGLLYTTKTVAYLKKDQNFNFSWSEG